jgi:hypothetical protein
MAERPWCSVVLRAWNDGGSVKVRVLIGDGTSDSVDVSTSNVEAALNMVRDRLEHLTVGNSRHGAVHGEIGHNETLTDE